MNKTTRRSFIRKTAAASAAGPFILPSHIWAAKVKPNDRIAMGFIGMGKQNGGLLSNFIGRDTQVLAVCEVDTTRRNHAKQRVEAHYKGKGQEAKCDAYNDFRKLTAREDIDAVCIATPDHWHAIPMLAALRSGKDVYCEKPLTHNIHEAKEVIAAVKKNGRVLQTGSMQRSSSNFRVACELVANGAIGKISHVHCSFGDAGRPCDLKTEEMEPGLDWEMWIGPGPLRGYSSVLSPRGVHGHFPNWRSFKEYGGGMVCDWGAHHLDIARWGLMRDGDGPVKVTPPPKDAQNRKRGARLHFDDGIYVEHKDGFGIEFYGSEGQVNVNRGRIEFKRGTETIAKWTRREDGGSLGGAVAKCEKEYLKDAKIKLYKSSQHIQNFLDCVKSRKKPICSEIVGGTTAISCHLMNQAYYNDTTINWDPKKNDFARGGDPKWLTRDYRGEWKV